MILDIRIPVGLLFTLIGIVLAAFGLATNTNPSVYTKSLGINANLYWGVALMIFGQTLFHIGRRVQLKMTAGEPSRPLPKEKRLKKR